MSLRPLHHQRPLAAFAAAYGAGVWVGVSFVFRPWASALGLALSLVSAALLPRIGRRRVAGAMGTALFLGMLLGGLSAHPALPPAGRYDAVRAVVGGDMRLRDDGTAAGYLENAVGTMDGAEIHLGRLYWTYTPDADSSLLPREGDAVQFSGKVYYPSGRVNPYGFDFRMYLLQKGAACGVSGGGNLQVTGHPGRGIASLLYAVRQGLERRVDAIFGTDGALPKALIIGDRTELPQETVRDFSRAGAAHILAVSGLHVALISAVLMLPLRKILRPGARAAVLGGFLLAYCALLNFSAAVVRAAVLLMIGALRPMARRKGDEITSLSAAFLLILLFRPLDLFSAGFQLSFCAVLGIAVMMPAIKRRWPRMLQESAGVTLAATVGSALPTIQIFHRFSLIGLLINPLACAVFALLLPLYFLTLGVGCLSLSAGRWLAAYVNGLSRLTVDAIRALGRLPFASVSVPALPWYCVLAVAAALILATRYVVWPRRRRLICGLSALILSFGVWAAAQPRNLRYVQLAVGQADCALILDGDQTAVVDAGEYGGDLADYLLATGRRADYLIFTHLHTDHCGGAWQLLEEGIGIGQVLLPISSEEQRIDPAALELMEELRGRGIPIRYVQAGDALRLPRAVMTVTWPRGNALRTGRDANRYSLSALWELEGVRLLTCGDLPGDYEAYAAADCDILKVSHHGSKSSTGADFLKAVTPRIALITGSAGSGLLPAQETLDRLTDAGALIWNTGICGAVTVDIRSGQAEVTPFLSPKEQP